MAASVDDYLWYQNNLTDLCTSGCLSSTKTWWSDVLTSCAGDSIIVNGRQVPPMTIPGRMLDGLNLACLTPGTDLTSLPGVVGVEITSTVISVVNSTVPFDPTAPNATNSSTLQSRQYQSFNPVFRSDGFHSNGHVPAGRDLSSRQSSSSFCLLESYAWVGQDIIRPDCSDSSTSSQCLDPTDVPDENQRIANLYPNSLLCSDCFLKMFYLRMASPYLPDLDASDYHLEQYLDIVDVCDAGSSMPELQVRVLPQYDNVAGVSDGSLEINSTVPSGTVVCNQTLTISDLESLSVSDPDAGSSVYCEALSLKYGVTTGDLHLAFNDYFCSPGSDFESVCVPAPCKVIQAAENSTCADIAKQAGQNVTTTQLINWNPNIIGLCDSLFPQYVCGSLPGGSYIPPPNANTSISNPVRGGGTGSSTGSGSVRGGGRNATVVPLGGPAPTPTQAGITPQCTEYVLASDDDGCFSLTDLWRVPVENFYAWNTVLGPHGENCLTQLWADTYYCIDIYRDPSSTTTTSKPTPTTTKITAPGPTQTGIIATCNKFAESIPDKGCEDFAVAEGITPAQLYAWNSVLGPNGENCSTSFWAGEYYCVGVSSSSSTTTTSKITTTTLKTTTKSTTTTTSTTTKTSVSPAGPTQTGIISTCNKFVESIPGLGCEDFAAAEHITPSLLYKWNTVLGSKGENCGTSFWAGEWYCVGVAPGGPTQDGIISSCNQYAESIPGLGCVDFAAAEGITAKQLYMWNTVLGANGENCGTSFWAGEWYCVGVYLS
ncbi:hypothetical protein F5B22DRAFT_626270 [Xylaria bambusicola]|uniref:uncharacterized protein n=1 Tax=Xylaria bambusicola TaxID=326684 RepID=UPI002007C3F1|nr:uncharacterized protein F5B22DRAFT_626270 [Xylaria bambusicola]KAI0505903.1 hypothetical protein F5B22DRAFT_626270 [Xylaria bambusicola]